jgi:hypothetical protein
MKVSVDLIFLIVCLLASFTSFFQKPSPLYLRIFPFYFIVTVLVQQIGNYLSQHSIPNAVLYNIYSMAEFPFYFFVLWCIIQNKRVKKAILFILILYSLTAALNLIYFKQGGTFHTVNYGIGCSLIVIFCIVYFVELFQLPKAINLKREPAFWICTAILFSYVCTFPFWGLVGFLSTAPPFIIKNLNIILMIINILSYSLFTIAFLCRIRIRKSTL